MASIKEKSLEWLGKLRNTYRLVVMNDETFQEVGSYKLSLLNVYIFLSTVGVLLSLAVGALIFFTPLKRYVPGYGSTSNDREMIRLNKQVEEMEEELAAFRTYTENVQRMLSGDVQTEKDVPKVKPSYSADSLAANPPEIPAVDEDLRREVALNELGRAAQEPRTSNFSPRDVPLEQMFFSPPIKGKISAGFDPDKKHFGTDVVAPQNTAIKSAMDGYVFFFPTGRWKPAIPSASNMPTTSLLFTNITPPCSRKTAPSSKPAKPSPSSAIRAPKPPARTCTLNSGTKAARSMR